MTLPPLSDCSTRTPGLFEILNQTGGLGNEIKRTVMRYAVSTPEDFFGLIVSGLFGGQKDSRCLKREIGQKSVWAPGVASALEGLVRSIDPLEYDWGPKWARVSGYKDNVNLAYYRLLSVVCHQTRSMSRPRKSKSAVGALRIIVCRWKAYLYFCEASIVRRRPGSKACRAYTGGVRIKCAQVAAAGRVWDEGRANTWHATFSRLLRS